MHRRADRPLGPFINLHTAARPWRAAHASEPMSGSGVQPSMPQPHQMSPQAQTGRNRPAVRQYRRHPEQEYFVDGVTESLTTDLSRMNGSFVIGRNTAFTYKGKPIDLKQIGRELNVRYVLEGSVQRGGNRMRVNVQLIDAESGSHLWAERFDKPVADLFDMQDEIVAHLANQLGTQLITARRRGAPNEHHIPIPWTSISRVWPA
jgi:TolB-like protein